MTTPPELTVHIPGSDQHDGHHLTTVTVPWICPVCAGPRGPVVRTTSYDGSRQLGCDGWTNPCGHVDLYATVRQEANEPRVARDPALRPEKPSPATPRP